MSDRLPSFGWLVVENLSNDGEDVTALDDVNDIRNDLFLTL